MIANVFFGFSFNRTWTSARTHISQRDCVRCSIRWSSTTSHQPLRVLHQGKITQQHVEQFMENTCRFSKVHVDLGTGDGKFVYRQAKACPQTFFVGVDIRPERMSYISWKMSRKPAKGGGIHNASFICSSLMQLPHSLSQLADVITINYPWGSLLSDLVVPNAVALEKISHLAKNGASLEVLLNYTVFQNDNYIESLKLPKLTFSYIESKLYPTYRSAGIRMDSHELQHNAGNKSTWGQKLTLGGQREVLRLTGIIKK
jgi:16S rRNA (adenine(1408)-N(1))-methyltransferase